MRKRIIFAIFLLAILSSLGACMSGNIIATPAYQAVDWQDFGTQVEKQRLGFIGLSLTEYDTDTVPQIAAGSCVEISGSIFQFASNESITGSLTSSAFNYIMLTVSGSGDSQTVAASWTDTAPSWNTSKQGYYDATNAKRYIGGCYYDGTNYKFKWIYQYQSTGPIARTLTPGIVGAAADTPSTILVRGYVGQVSVAYGKIFLRADFPERSVVTSLYSNCELSSGTIYAILSHSDRTDRAAGTAMATNSHSSTGALTDTSITDPVIDEEEQYYITLDRSNDASAAYWRGVSVGYTYVKR